MVAIGAVALAVSGCGGTSSDGGPTTASPRNAQTTLIQTVSSPAVSATVRELPNPLRGQYEALLLPLFPQGNPAQRGHAAWPRSDDASTRVSWRQLQPVDPRTLPPDAPDDRKYDFSVIDDTLAQLDSRGVRLMLRVLAYNSCCNASYPDNTNAAVPDWLRGIPGAVTNFESNGVTQVVPNWNSPAYLSGFEQLLAALGRRYDRDERLSVFEFSGYGDFSENHVAYLRDELNAPGPSPRDSTRSLGYFSQYRDQSITSASIQRLVAANVAAFPRTRLVTTPQNPEIVRQLMSDSTTVKLAAPVGIRSDCLGVYEPLPAWAHDDGSEYVKNADPLVDQIAQRWRSAPVITEWCQLPTGADRRAYYEKGLRDVVAFHVSMTSSVNFPDRDAAEPMPDELFGLWSRANAFAGYRYSVEAAGGTESLNGGVAAVDVRWMNDGAAAAAENWAASYQVIDPAGAVVRTIPATIDLKTLVGTPSSGSSVDEPAHASATDPVRIDTAGLRAGKYTISASVSWNEHKPDASHVVNYAPMQLARDGRDADGRYPVATFTVVP